MGFGFANGVLTARILLPEGRGILGLSLTLGSTLALLAGMGTNVAFRAMLPRGEVGLRNFLRLTLLLLPLMVMLSVVGAIWSLRSFHTADVVALIAAVAAISVLAFCANQSYDVLNAAGRNSDAAAMSAIGTGFVTLILGFGFLRGLSFGGVLLCYLLAYCVRQLLLSARIHQVKGSIERNLEGSERKMLRLGVRFMGLNVGQAFTFRVDLIFVEFLAGAAAAGVYTVSATPAAVLQVFSNSIGQVVFRRVADGSFGRKLVLRYSLLALSLTMTGALGIWLLSDWMIPFVFGPSFIEAVPVLKLLGLAEVCLSPYLVLSRAAAGLKKARLASGSGALGITIMSLTLVALVPEFGAWGAAWACVITYSVMSVFIAIPVLRVLPR